jgi:hypothetical protein
MANAQLQYRVKPSGGAFGALLEESTTVASGDTIRLSAASYAGWGSAARWEITAFPPDWPCPTGWSTDASSGAYYYLAGSGGSGVAPPDIEIPDEGDYWGKWLFRLTVNGTIVSAKIGVKTKSPLLELDDEAFGEGRQWGGSRSYVGDQQTNARKLDAAALVVGGFVSAITATRPIKASAATGPVTVSWEPNATVANAGYGFSGCPSIANAAGALSLDAATTVAIGETDATLVKIGRTGQTVRLPAFAGGGTQGLVVDNNGNVGVGAAGASSTAAYLENASTALNANGVPIQDLATGLLFSCQDAPVALRRTAVTDNAVYETLPIEVYPESGVGATGSGPRIHARCLDDAGDLVDVATIDFPLTSAASVALGGAGHASKLIFKAATAGTLIEVCSMSASALTTTVPVSVPRLYATPDSPVSSGGAVTFDLSRSQNITHTTTENTTVTISGGTSGQRGTIVVSQGAVGKTLTMPADGTGVEYDNTIEGLGLTAIIDTTALTRTILDYYVLPNGKAAIVNRAVITIP